MSPTRPDPPGLRLDPVSHESGSRCCVAMAGGVNPAARCQTWKFITTSFGVIPAKTPTRTSSDSASHAMPMCITAEELDVTDGNPTLN